MKPNVRISLENMAGVLLIVLRPSGVTYSNQTGHVGCVHSKAEGILAPFNNDAPFDQPQLSTEAQLTSLFSHVNPFRVSEESADEIDAIFQGFPETSFVSVDRSRLMDSHEAWIYVDVDDSECTTLSGIGKSKGVVTWCNSD